MSLMPVELAELASVLIVAIGWALLFFVGQGLVIGLIVAAILRTVRDRSADLRYGVACLGLLIMMFCPVATTVWGLTWGRNGNGISGGEQSADPSLALSQNTTREAVVGTTRADAGWAGFRKPRLVSPADPAARPAGEPGWAWREQVESWLPILVAAWLAGVVVLALRLSRGLVDVRGLTGSGLLSLPDELQAMIDKLAERSGLRRPVRWFLSLRVEVPTVAGWLRPMVLIPVKGWSQLAVQQLEALLAHEIAHIRRHDYFVNICQVCIKTVLFFHPAVWWVSKRIRAERENCCDDLAVTLCGGDRLRVARALFALEEQRGAPMLRVAANGGHLRERIRRLVAPTPGAACPTEAAWAGAGVSAAAIGLVAMVWLVGTTHARVDGPPRAAATQAQSQVPAPAAAPEPSKPVKGFGESRRGEIPDGAREMLTPETERAIKNGLAWLAGTQNADGSFGSGTYRGNIAVTSVAGLAFMASGSSPGRGPYGAQIDKALTYVMANTSPAGFVAVVSPSTHGPMYSHGFGTLFLAEAYGITHRPEIREKLQKAVRLIIDSQNNEGGWRYQPVKADADISVTICQINALRAARNAGLDVPKETVNGYIRYVKQSQNADGGFRYMLQGGASAFPRSAAGVVAIQSAGDRDSKEVRDGLAYLRQFIGGIKLGNRYSHYYYGHYYAAQAMWLRGGGDWAEWYPAIRDELLKRKTRQDYWMDNSVCNEYGTAMALIILQIPNNYLPIFQR
jgi:beta-lactamase regulating signal transducer with metallopeptidase domain